MTHQKKVTQGLHSPKVTQRLHKTTPSKTTQNPFQPLIAHQQSLEYLTFRKAQIET